MNKTQLEQVRKLLKELGIEFKELEQRITNIDNKFDKEVIILTCQIRIEVANKT